jgi:hypothetical protein
MSTTGDALEVVTWRPDGVDSPIGSPALRILVIEGVTLDVAFASEEPKLIVTELTLSGVREVDDGPGPAPPRFVIIPVDAGAALAGVAEPSLAPAELMPILSTPTWATLDGRQLARDASVAARGGGIQVAIQLIPGPWEGTGCIVQIRAARLQSTDAQAAGADLLWIRHLSPQTVRFAAG